MSSHEHDGEIEAGRIEHGDVGYDRSDLSAHGIISFLIGLAVACVFIGLISWGLFRYFGSELIPSATNSAIVTPNRALPTGDPTLRFPRPVLQPDPTADLNKFRIAVEEQLNTYSWADKNAGVVRIPVERAIDIVAQKGLPARPAPPALPQAADFATGAPNVPGAGGGTEPRGNQ